MKKIISIVKDNKLLCIFSILESFLQVYGFMLTNDKSLADFNYKYFLMFLIILIIVLGINTIYFKIISLNYKNNYKYNFSKKNFLLTWGFLFLMWIPVLLAYYPTIWSYDVRNEVAHLIGVKLSIFHPILHILFIELFLFIGKKICSYEFGMLLLSIVQMLIMSAIFGSMIGINKKKK